MYTAKYTSMVNRTIQAEFSLKCNNAGYLILTNNVDCLGYSELIFE